MARTKRLAKAEIKVGLDVKDIVAALKELEPEDREFFIENLVAATNPEYLKSVAEARADYRAGRTVPHKELFQD